MVLITGYRGLAETLIEEFYQHRYRLSVLVRADHAIPSLSGRYPEAQLFRGDVAVGADCKNWISAALARFGRIDCLINNAAVTGPGGKTNDISFVDFRIAHDINFLAPVRLIKFVLPTMLAQNSGVVINLSGGGATGPRAYFGAYASAKTALVRFTETVALEYPELRFYAISPGALMTPMIEKVLEFGDSIGPEYGEAKRRQKEGGEDPSKAARLARWLTEKKPKILSGTLMSAIWDDVPSFDGLPKAVDWWKLRRVDNHLIKSLRKEKSCRRES